MRSLILFLALIGCAGLAQAQTFTLGPKAGFNRTSLEFNNAFSIKGAEYNYSHNKSATTLTYGGFLRMKLGGMLFVQPEVMWNNTKADLEFSAGGTTQSHQFTASSLDVPLLAGLKLGPVRLMGGPLLRFNKTHSLDTDFWTTSAQPAGEMMAGYQLGGGLDIGRLAFDIRYQKADEQDGFTVQHGTEAFAMNYSESTIQATVGIKLFK